VFARGLPLLVPLLFLAVYLWDGIRALAGALRRGVSTFTNRLTGTSSTRPTTADFSSRLVPGDLSVEWGTPLPRHLWSSYGVPGSSGSAMEVRGVNGPQRLRSVD
jgi:hypothetical protein